MLLLGPVRATNPFKADIHRHTLPVCALGSPKVFEARWRQFRISHRVLNIFVAEVGLQRPGIMPSVRQCITARMAQHVRMHTEFELGLLAQSGHHLGEARAGEWAFHALKRTRMASPLIASVHARRAFNRPAAGARSASHS